MEEMKERNELENETTETALLEELIRLQKKNRNLLRGMLGALCVLAAAVVIALLVLVPKAAHTLAQADELILQTDALVEETNTLVTGTNRIVEDAGKSLEGIDVMVDNVNALVTENTETVTESLEKINNIDFDSLNHSIQELSDVLQPLQNFVNMFK